MGAESVGFRFHPTEEELIDHFLVLKLTGHDDHVDDVIGEIDVFRREPWELPHFAQIRSDDPVWYFFCYLEKKYPNGKKVNRRTTRGVWKLTGAVRDIKARRTKELIGKQKKMVFHRKVKGSRDVKTHWVIHEYQHISTLDDPNALVLCKLKIKATAGSSLGEDGFSVDPDVENHTTQPTIFEIDAAELLYPIAGVAVDLPLSIQPDVSDDEYEVDPIIFADSLLNADECEVQSSMRFSNSAEGQTSTSQHRQMKATNGDDTFIMGAGPVHSSRVSHGEVNSVEWPRDAFQANFKLETRPQSLNIKADDELPLRGGGRQAFPKEGREAVKHGATKYEATNGTRAVDEEIPRIRKLQPQLRLASEEVKVSMIRKPQRQLKFTSKEAGQNEKEKEMHAVLTSEPGRDLSSEASTSNNQKSTIIRPKEPPLSHYPGPPPYVYLANIVIGLSWGITLLWDMLQ